MCVGFALAIVNKLSFDNYICVGHIH